MMQLLSTTLTKVVWQHDLRDTGTHTHSEEGIEVSHANIALSIEFNIHDCMNTLHQGAGLTVYVWGLLYVQL